MGKKLMFRGMKEECLKVWKSMYAYLGEKHLLGIFSKKNIQ